MKMFESNHREWICTDADLNEILLVFSLVGFGIGLIAGVILSAWSYQPFLK